MKTLNIFAVGLALVLSVNAQAETKIKVMRSFEFVDKESYGNGESKSKKSFVSLKVNILDVEIVEATSCDYGVEQAECVPTTTRKTERISFNSCSYEAGEKKVCTLLGAEDGYKPSVAKEKLYNYDEERNSEWVTTALLGAGVTIAGVVRWRMIRSDRIKAFQSGKSAFSWQGDDFLFNKNLPFMRNEHLANYGILLASLVVGKEVFIDNAGDIEEKMHHYDSLTTGGESNFGGNIVMVVEDFDAEKMINKLSRALLQ